MNSVTDRRWRRLGILDAGIPIERFGTAGLSSDGRFCITTDVDCTQFCVWDTEKQIQVWEADQAYINHYGSPFPNYPWEFAEVVDGPAKGLYRLFGCDMEVALKEFGSQKNRLENDSLIITDSTASNVFQ